MVHLTCSDFENVPCLHRPHDLRPSTCPNPRPALLHPHPPRPRARARNRHRAQRDRRVLAPSADYSSSPPAGHAPPPFEPSSTVTTRRFWRFVSTTARLRDHGFEHDPACTGMAAQGDGGDQIGGGNLAGVRRHSLSAASIGGLPAKRGREATDAPWFRPQLHVYLGSDQGSAAHDLVESLAKGPSRTLARSTGPPTTGPVPLVGQPTVWPRGFEVGEGHR